MASNKIISLAVVDDHPLLLDGLRNGLNRFDDCAVDIMAVNGQDLINQLGTAKRLPDVCLLDISMPVMDGYETLIQAGKRWPDIRFIMLSQHFNEFSIIKAYRNGAKGYLPKEVRCEDIHHAITHVFNGELYFAENANHFISNMQVNQSINTDLSPKELEFLRHACTDIHYKTIAEKMDVSMRTVDGYRDRLFDKLKVKSRPGLVALAISAGIKPLDNIAS